MKAVDTSVRLIKERVPKKSAVPIQYLRSDEMLTCLMSVSLFYRYFRNLLWNKKSLTSEKTNYPVRSDVAGNAHSSIARANVVPRCISLH